MSATDKPLLSVRDLKKHFPIKGGILGRTQAMVCLLYTSPSPRD